MTSTSDDEPPFSSGARLAEETRLLLDALAERAEPWLIRMAAGHDGEHIPATCNWCPLCVALAVLRGQRPELAVRAAEHAAGLVAVLRAALADPHPAGWASPDGPPGTDDASAGEGDTTDGGVRTETRSRRVQRIEVRRRDPGAPEC